MTESDKEKIIEEEIIEIEKVLSRYMTQKDIVKLTFHMLNIFRITKI